MNNPTLPLQKSVLLAVLISVDIASVIILFRGENLFLALMLHGLASLAGTLLLTWKKSVNKPKKINYLTSGFLFLFQFILILPVIGFIGAFIFSQHKLFINQKDKHDEEVDVLLNCSDDDTLELPLDKNKKYRELLRYQDPETYLQVVGHFQYRYLGLF